MTKVSCDKSCVYHKRDISKAIEKSKVIKKIKEKEEEMVSTCVSGKRITISMKQNIHPISKKKTKIISFAQCECGKIYHSKYSFETPEDVCTFLNDMH